MRRAIDSRDAKGRRRGKGALLIGGLALGAILAVAFGTWILVDGTKELGLSSKSKASSASDVLPGFQVQSAYADRNAGVVHVLAGLDPKTSEAALDELVLWLDGDAVDATWTVYRDADGSVVGPSPTLTDGDLIEFVFPFDLDAERGDIELRLGPAHDRAILDVPAYSPNDGIVPFDID